MKIKKLKPNHSISESYQINDHVIEINCTVFKQYRVCIREVDSVYYITNWCAGPDENHVQILMKVSALAISRGLVDQLKHSSRIKPYFNDPDFVKHLRSFNLDYSTIEDFPIDLKVARAYQIMCNLQS